jgi:hypothetical protein
MSRGVVLFAHASESVDYGTLSIIAGGLAKKYLKVPVSVITDQFTIDKIKDNNNYNLFEDIFDQIILVDVPQTTNQRLLNNGAKLEKIPFINSNRSSIYNLTPYDTTLLLDSDFLVFTDTLNNYWDLNFSLMISPSMNDIIGDRIGILDRNISETGPSLLWATTVMFKKDQYSRLFFDLVQFIKDNYKYYSELYKIDPRVYRNDISFSIAKHILDGFCQNLDISLPPILTVQSKDLIEKVRDDGTIIFLVDYFLNDSEYVLTSIKNQDIHIMNKQSILNHKDTLLELI